MINISISKSSLKNGIKIKDYYIQFNGEFIKNKDKILLINSKEIVGEINLKKSNLVLFRNNKNGLPLYYYRTDSSFLISSHVKFFIENKVSLEENKELLGELLFYGYIIQRDTIYKNIKRVLIGEKLKINLENLSMNIEKFKIPIKKRDIFSLYNIKELLIKNINKKKFSLLFSGGLDSSILLKILEERKCKFLLYSTGFEFQKVDHIEREYSLSAAKIMDVNTEYKTFSFNELILTLPEIIKATEGPVMHIQTLLLYMILKNNRKKCFEYILNGQGADAIFGTKHQFDYLNNKKREKWIEKSTKFTSKNWNLKSDIFYNRKIWINSMKKLNYLDKSFLLTLQGDCDLTSNCWAKCAESLGLNMVFPYLEESLLQEVCKIKWETKLKKPKFMLRKLAEEINIPKSIIERKKGNFGPLSTGWAKEMIKLKPLFYEIFPKDEIDTWFNEEDKRYILWNVLNYKIWKDIFIENKEVNAIKLELKKLLY